MNVVLDASVVLKWFLRDHEDNLDEATAILKGIATGTVHVSQPAHWLIEVVAVVTRVRPGIAERAIRFLHALGLPVVDGIEIHQRATALAVRSGQHMFDTLYHAVALETNAVLVTADVRYLRASRGAGSIIALAEWTDPA